MPFTDGISPEPTAVATSPPSYSTPSHADLAAVAATVAIVGVFMALLVTWLVLRLRRASQRQPASTPVPSASYNFRPSFAPSEASSKFGFIRKPLRLSHRRKDGSWDFADPDPFSPPKECPFDTAPSMKHRPPPLSPVPAYTHRPSLHKDDSVPRTPTTPASFYFVEPPPPAYCPNGASWQPHSPKSPC